MWITVQIYGVTTAQDAVMSAELGADHVGVAVDEEGLAPDGVSASEARAILSTLPPPVTPVALTLSRDPDEVEYVAGEVRPKILHVGADLDAVRPDHVVRLKQRVPGVKIMRAVPVEGRSAIESAVEAASVADYLLLDTRDQTSGKIGATGRPHDWSVSAEIVKSVDVPVVLAGGLSADNVGEAIRVVRPWGVDSYSLTCAEGNLRKKDRLKVGAFVGAVRRQAARA
jgi:phosphoribosylanthranilate isomerase